MKLNRKWVLVIALLLSVAVATAGTLAYLSDSDADVNTMTLGSVYIVQNEQERREDGTLDEFTQDKPAYPAVGPIEWADKGIVMNGEEYKVFTDELANVIDKIVTVTNTGKSDAYVRTIVAIEAPENDPKSLIHINVNGDVPHTKWTLIKIDGVDYVYSVFTYEEALKPGETSAPSLLQLFLDSKAGNEDVEMFGDTWDVLVLSQAVQTAGFDDAATALNTGFDEVTEANLIKWLGETEVGSPGDKNETNNPPEKELPTTKWVDYADTSWYTEDATEYTISSAEQLAGLAVKVNQDKVTFKGKTVKLGADIDLGEHLWEPIGQTGATEFKGVFDGNNKVISNMYVDSSDETGAHYSSGLFGWVESHDSEKVTIKNVVVDRAYVTGHHNVAVIAGYIYGYVDNCTVTNATVICTHANNDACGDKAGVIAGYAGDGAFTNNTAKNCTVTASRDAGQMFGCVIASQMKNHVGNSAENVTVEAEADSECVKHNTNIKNEIFGRY